MAFCGELVRCTFVLLEEENMNVITGIHPKDISLERLLKSLALQFGKIVMLKDSSNNLIKTDQDLSDRLEGASRVRFCVEEARSLFGPMSRFLFGFFKVEVNESATQLGQLFLSNEQSKLVMGYQEILDSRALPLQTVEKFSSMYGLLYEDFLDEITRTRIKWLQQRNESTRSVQRSKPHLDAPLPQSKGHSMGSSAVDKRLQERNVHQSCSRCHHKAVGCHYRCLHCDDTLCTACESLLTVMEGVHPPGHILAKISHPNHLPVPVPLVPTTKTSSLPGKVFDDICLPAFRRFREKELDDRIDSLESELSQLQGLLHSLEYCSSP